MRLHCFAFVMVMALPLLHKPACFGAGQVLQASEPWSGPKEDIVMPKPWKSELNRHVLFYKLFPQAATWRTLPVKTFETWRDALGRTNEELNSEVTRFRAEKFGYYRSISYRGRWWLIDPEGRLFLSAGVTKFKVNKGAQHDEPRMVPEEQRLRQWGFNTAGAGSDVEALRKEPGHMAYTVTRWPGWTAEVGPLEAFTQELNGGLRPVAPRRPISAVTPVFHPDFPAFVDRHAAGLAVHSNEKRLLGYFLDQNLPHPNLKVYLEAKDEGLHKGARAAAGAWLQSRGKTPETYDDTDARDWAAYVYEQYCLKIIPAMRRHDPNHLILGPCLNSASLQSPEVLEAIGKHCDVVCVEPGNAPIVTSEQLETWSQWASRPVLLSKCLAVPAGESSPRDDRNRRSTWVLPDQAQKGLYYQALAFSASMSKGCIGWHWHQYQDQVSDRPRPALKNTRPGTSLPSHESEGQEGLVAASGQPYEDFIEKVQEANQTMYGLAASTLQPEPSWHSAWWAFLGGAVLFTCTAWTLGSLARRRRGRV